MNQYPIIFLGVFRFQFFPLAKCREPLEILYHELMVHIENLSVIMSPDQHYLPVGTHMDEGLRDRIRNMIGYRWSKRSIQSPTYPDDTF